MQSELIERLAQTKHGFTDIKRAAQEIVGSEASNQLEALIDELYSSDVVQARMCAVFLMGYRAAANPVLLEKMRETVSADPAWQVQEILAQAFDQFCKDTGYQAALPIIQDWLQDSRANVRHAVSEGLRIWTACPYFKGNPQAAIDFLSPLKADDSDYVRRSAGNALRDISRKHADLIRAELATWDMTDQHIAQTYKLASEFL